MRTNICVGLGRAIQTLDQIEEEFFKHSYYCTQNMRARMNMV
jgi:hypothetical protein